MKIGEILHHNTRIAREYWWFERPVSRGTSLGRGVLHRLQSSSSKLIVQKDPIPPAARRRALSHGGSPEQLRPAAGVAAPAMRMRVGVDARGGSAVSAWLVAAAVRRAGADQQFCRADALSARHRGHNARSRGLLLGMAFKCEGEQRPTQRLCKCLVATCSCQCVPNTDSTLQTTACLSHALSLASSPELVA